MKQIITLLLFVFAFATQSNAAVQCTVVPGVNTTTVNVDYKKDSFFGKVKMFVAKKVAKLKKIVKGMSDDDILMLVLIYFISPIAMYKYEGDQWTNRVTVNLILWILCWLPGVIHAAYIIYGKK